MKFFQFGLIVTGETEEQCLPRLFRSLAAQGTCSFRVIRRIGQRSPIRSETRRLRMVGKGQTVPPKDEAEIGITARLFLTKSDSRYVLLVDDLEADRANDIEAVFARYRLALDEVLAGLAHKAAVHFLVNMLEAYYFAHTAAVNDVLGTNLGDFAGDVETIRNPKGELKSRFPAFNEIEHGTRIVSELNVQHILARSDTCASLRTMFEWASEAIGERDWVPPGRLLPTTQGQIDTLREHIATDG